MAKKEFRPHELDLTKSVGITGEVHDILKKERQKQQKSMARIINDLILKEYAYKK